MTAWLGLRQPGAEAGQLSAVLPMDHRKNMGKYRTKYRGKHLDFHKWGIPKWMVNGKIRRVPPF